MSFSRLTRSVGLALAGYVATAACALAQSMPSPEAKPVPQAEPAPPALAAPAGAGPAAAPLNPGDGIRKERRAGPMRVCRNDMRTLCGNVVQGGRDGRVARFDCLVANRDKVSADCAAVISEIEGRMQGRRASAEPRAALSGEAAPAGEGRLSVAPTVKEARRAMRQACRADVASFCKDAPRERGGLRKCLTDHSDKLSASCADALAQLPGRRARGG